MRGDGLGVRGHRSRRITDPTTACCSEVSRGQSATICSARVLKSAKAHRLLPRHGLAAIVVGQFRNTVSHTALGFTLGLVHGNLNTSGTDTNNGWTVGAVNGCVGRRVTVQLPGVRVLTAWGGVVFGLLYGPESFVGLLVFTGLCERLNALLSVRGGHVHAFVQAQQVIV